MGSVDLILLWRLKGYNPGLEVPFDGGVLGIPPWASTSA